MGFGAEIWKVEKGKEWIGRGKVFEIGTRGGRENTRVFSKGGTAKGGFKGESGEEGMGI